MASKKTVKKQRIKKKKWFEIALPQLLKGAVFAESYAESADDLIGRSIKTNLGEVLSSGKRFMNIKLIVDDVKTSTASTKIKSIEVSLPYILRKTRKNSKISAKIVGKTSDDVKVDLRLCAITRGHCLTTTKKDIRKRLEEFMQKALKENKKDNLIMELITNNIQNNIKKDLKKLIPMKSIELEKIIIL